MGDILGKTEITVPTTDDAIYLVNDADGEPSDGRITLANLFGKIPSMQVNIGDTENANMTVGLTINQGADDDEIIALKSSDVAHGMTDVAETDTYASFLKSSSTGGGLRIQGMRDSGGAANRALELLGYLGENVSTTKSASGKSIVEFGAAQISGTADADIVADGNAFGFLGHVGGDFRTLFIIDENGDYYYDGVDGGAFDAYDDLSLVRAFSMVTGGKEVIKSKWDEFVSHKEKNLVELGILGAPVKDGGLVNGAQLQRLHNGAIWQLAEKIFELEQKLLEA